MAFAVDGGRSDMELFSGEKTVADGELVIGLRVRCLGKKADRALGGADPAIFPMPTGEGSPSINASTNWRPAGVSLWVRDRLVEARARFV